MHVHYFSNIPLILVYLVYMYNKHYTETCQRPLSNELKRFLQFVEEMFVQGKTVFEQEFKVICKIINIYIMILYACMHQIFMSFLLNDVCRSFEFQFYKSILKIKSIYRHIDECM